MQVVLVNIAGLDEALFGIGLSYGITSEFITDDLATSIELNSKLLSIADKLAAKGGAHAKFLESICVWIDVTAPRYWWQQFDTYRVGVTKQSESTMHTLMRKPLDNADFRQDIYACTLRNLNDAIQRGDFEEVKINLPESFYQRRMVCTNLKVLKHMYNQRKNHRLEEWQIFFRRVRNALACYGINRGWVFE